MTEALPADDERRTFTVVYTAYLALSLTDPALAITPLVRNSTAVINVVAAHLRAAQAAGDTPVHLDPDLEAFSLLAMSAGLGTSLLVGQSSVDQAQAVIDYHLYRLFPHRSKGTTAQRQPSQRAETMAHGLLCRQIRSSRTNGDTRPRNTSLPIPCPARD
jgi:hypothetical protein